MDSASCRCRKYKGSLQFHLYDSGLGVLHAGGLNLLLAVHNKAALPVGLDPYAALYRFSPHIQNYPRLLTTLFAALLSAAPLGAIPSHGDLIDPTTHAIGTYISQYAKC